MAGTSMADLVKKAAKTAAPTAPAPTVSVASTSSLTANSSSGLK